MFRPGNTGSRNDHSNSTSNGFPPMVVAVREAGHKVAWRLRGAKPVELELEQVEKL
jgi:hypothetical protein